MYYTILRNEHNKEGQLTVERLLETAALYKTIEECFEEIKRIAKVYEKYDYDIIDEVENDKAIITKNGIIIELFIYRMFEQ